MEICILNVKGADGVMDKKILTEYFNRFCICILGLFFFAVGTFLGVKAGSAGTNAWSTLALGVAEKTGITFGTSSLLISLVIILIDILGKGKIGFGTLMNAVLVSVFSDILLNALTFVPEASNGIIGTVYTLIGQTVVCFATILYMKPALGCGPRDTLMVIVGCKFPKVPIGTVKFGVEMCVLVVGVILGAPFGVGTVLVVMLQAAIFQFACRVCRYEPRDVIHEDFADTIRRFTGK
jgi:uncharacterized membrane protein YczE